jgi:hypothetical protein
MGPLLRQKSDGVLTSLDVIKRPGTTRTTYRVWLTTR